MLTSNPSSSMSKVLVSYRNHLQAMGARLIGRDLQAKVGVSDIVQMVLVDFWLQESKIQAKTDAQRYGWIRRAFFHRLINARRLFTTLERDISREETMSLKAEHVVAPDITSVGKHEEQFQLTQAIDTAISDLPAHYRIVIELRSIQKLGFFEVGQQLGLSADAATKLYARAIQRLRETLGSEHDPRR